MIKDTTETFWGKPCKYGHVNEEGKTQRYARHSKHCITCNRIQSAAWHKNPANQERIKEQKERAKPKKAAWQKDWCDRNREHYREYQRNYRREYIKRNPEKIKEIEQRYYDKKGSKDGQPTVE